jgi:hypothetical protein
MTVSELYLSVAQLGFETSLEDESSFINTANRALLQVNALRPAAKSYFLNHYSLDNVIENVSTNKTMKISGSDTIFTASRAKAYYFEAKGFGEYYIEMLQDDDWKLIGEGAINSTTSFTQLRGFIKKDGSFYDGRVRIRFYSECILFIRNIAIYEEIYSKSVDDIPQYGSTVRYDMRVLVDDFMSFKDPPITNDESFARLNQNYDIESESILILPYDKKGNYKINYNRMPKLLKYNGGASSDTTVIDLDEDLAMLLPTLIASYIWVDDEPEKATHYLSLYNSLAAFIVSTRKNSAPTHFIDETGWGD